MIISLFEVRVIQARLYSDEYFQTALFLLNEICIQSLKVSWIFMHDKMFIAFSLHIVLFFFQGFLISSLVRKKEVILKYSVIFYLVNFCYSLTPKSFIPKLIETNNTDIK